MSRGNHTETKPRNVRIPTGVLFCSSHCQAAAGPSVSPGTLKVPLGPDEILAAEKLHSSFAGRQLQHQVSHTRRHGSRADQPRRIRYQARGRCACHRHQRLAAAAQELQRLYAASSRRSSKMLQLTILQCSSARRITLPSPRDARPSPVTSSRTSRLVSSTSTSHRTLLPTKSSHGSSACSGTQCAR